MTRIVLSQLLSIFQLHGGFVPGSELLAEGFSIDELVARRLIAKDDHHLAGGTYIMGPEMEREVRSQKRVLPDNAERSD